MTTHGNRYLSFSLHFINLDWKLEKICVGVYYDKEITEGCHIEAEVLSSFIEGIIKNLQIEKKLFLMTTDGEAREIKFVSLLKIEHNYCLDHLIDLSSKEGHSEIVSSLEKHNSLITLFSKSAVGKDYLKIEQLNENVDKPLLLKKGCLTRQWLGNFKSLERTLLLKKFCY